MDRHGRVECPLQAGYSRSDSEVKCQLQIKSRRTMTYCPFTELAVDILRQCDLEGMLVAMFQLPNLCGVQD